MTAKERISLSIEERRERLCNISDRIWEYAETRYEEYKSSALLCETLTEEGFTVECNVAGMETAFVASYGSGQPVIAFLGEFDALYGMSQIAGILEKKPLVEGGNGHGCGHHALGTGSLAAALALKDYIKNEGLEGTVRYVGCPAEEGGCGKVYLARAGIFQDVDAAFAWHPFTSSNVMTFNVLATASAYFKFHGKSAHAAGSPHLGRSALDAVELMNVGVNFLREHVEQEVRLHYAITDAGGCSPNVVQADAAVLQQIRAPKISQVSEVYNRVIDIAKGAALMTGTTLEIVFDKASCDYKLNHTLGKLVHSKLLEAGSIPISESDIAEAEQVRQTMSEKEKQLDETYAVSVFGLSSEEVTRLVSGKNIINAVYPYNEKEIIAMGSSDLADVSWHVPTASFQVVSFAKDTSPHSWQQVAQGKTELCHKGMLHAGKVMALAGVELLHNATLLKQAREEFDRRLPGENYVCMIPSDIKPGAKK